MKLEDHEKESIKLFGKPFTEVHRWLDEFAQSKEYGMRHRKKRHHLAGVSEVKKLFGEEASIAAEQHIKSDLKEEGWNESDPFPKDEDDYVKIGFY